MFLTFNIYMSQSVQVKIMFELLSYQLMSFDVNQTSLSMKMTLHPYGI